MLYDFEYAYIKELQKENAGLRKDLVIALEEKDCYEKLAKEYCLAYAEECKKNMLVNNKKL